MILLAVIGLGFLVYSNSFGCSFHFDDDAYVINDFAIRNWHNLVDIWNICPCRIVTFLSLAFNYHFNGLNVFGYHAVNLMVHLANSVLVWWLVFLTFKTPALKNEKISVHANSIAVLTALIFVSHPVQTEAVTYIWQRAASMAAFFYLCSLCFYIQSRLRHSDGYYFLSLITAVLAMFTKENAITLPLMIVFYEFTFLKTKKEIDWVKLYPFWIVLFIIPQTMVLTKTARAGELQSIVSGPGGITPFHYLLTQFRVIITYMRLCFVPVHLNLDYDYPVYKSFFDLPVCLSFLALGGIAYAARQLWSKYKLISFAIAWFFITLLPESSILPQSDVIFEHRLYLPLIGYALFLVTCSYYFFADKNLKAIIAVLVLVIAVNAVLTFERNKVWQNELTLWNDVVQKSPHKARPYINRGWAYYNEGDDAKAMADYDKAIEIGPEYIYPHDDKGLIYAEEGNKIQALAEYNKAISINPWYSKVYYHRGLITHALADFDRAIELNPEYIDAYNERGRLYIQQGKTMQGLADYKKSLSIDPGQMDIQEAFKTYATSI